MPNRKISDKMVFHIEQLARAHYRGTQIQEKLSLLQATEGNPLGDEEIPALRTIQKYAQRVSSESIETWTLGEDDGDLDDARLVLDMIEWLAVSTAHIAASPDNSDPPLFNAYVARYLAEQKLPEATDTDSIGYYSVPHLTRGEAHWVVRLRKTAPTLWPRYAGLLYALVLQYERTPLSQRGYLDTFLALHPWDSAERAKWYLKLLEAGLSKSAGDRQWWLAYAIGGIIEDEGRLASGVGGSEHSDVALPYPLAPAAALAAALSSGQDDEGGDDGTR